jgi:hypothetical protein
LLALAGTLAAGVVSYAAALGVGVTIEEADMDDLAAAIAESTSVPLDTTYSHLLTGSEHHLRTFDKLIDRLD